MKELKELKRIDEQNRLNESLARLNTKTHKTLHNKLINNNGTNHHVNQSNGASSSIVNNNNNSSKNATSTNQSTGNNNNNSQNNQKTHQSNGGGGNNSSKSGSNKSLTSENSLNSNSKNSHNNSPHTHDTDDLNKINLVDASSCGNGEAEKREELTWIHELFQGILVNETKCLNCETSSSKEENFLDLSVDVEQNTSISHCLQEFSNMEMLCGECKYYCENCCSKQEAEKRLDFFQHSF